MRSTPGTQAVIIRASREALARSDIRALSAPGYWIFTATGRPSFQTARCTWPMLAAAAGLSSKDWNLRRHCLPKFSTSTACTFSAGSAGACSCSFVSVARYGRGDVLGQGGLEDAHRLADLHRPALELPEHAEHLLGGARLQLGGDGLGRGAADPLADPEGRPARVPDRQGRHLGAAGQGTHG